jgi:predicted transcriptional regulator YdeE
MQIMGISTRTTNENAQSAKDLGALWERFFAEQMPSKIPYQKTGEVVGLYCDYESDHSGAYTGVAGFEVTVVGDVPEGMAVKHLPAAKYAVFEISGPFPEKLQEAWQWIWKSDLKRTYTGDFDLYQIGFDGDEHTDIHIYIAIE